MDIPQPLIRDIAEGRCLPFIGAGFSLNADLPTKKSMPTWPELGRLLSGVLRCSELEDPADVAAMFERKFGRVHLIETIRDALHPDYARPGIAHHAFARLPFDTIYTTNFDLLLEDSFALLQKPFRSLVGELQMPFHGGHLTTSIVKMHGDITHAEYMVVTRRDYDAFLESYPVIATFLSAMLITRTALFIGYSRTDQDFMHIEEVVRSRLGQFQRMPYIVQFNVSEDDVEKLLDQHLHVISLPVARDQSRAQVLTDFFTSILSQLDIIVGREIRENRPEAFESIPEAILERTYKADDASQLFSSSSNLCFVIMPFTHEFDRVYRYLVRPAVEQEGLETIRADEFNPSVSVMEQVRVAIQQSRLCVADVSDHNPNVMYELAIAQTLSKPLVLISRRGEPLPFDISNLPVVYYDPEAPENALLELRSVLRNAQSRNRLEEAANLIANGMYRAGVAMLGVLLEYALQQLSDLGQFSGGTDASIRVKPVSSWQMLRNLVKSGQISKEEEEPIRRFIEIRNKAVHQLEEPTQDEAQFALSTIKNFVGRHLPAGALP